jgi:omega-amidase
MKIIIAIAQMAIALGEPEQNRTTARALATEAAVQGADLLILLELWSTGYDLARADTYAAPLDRGDFGHMAALAREYGLYVVGSALETNPDGLPFNTAVLYDPDGALKGTYHKVHLWAPLGEAEHMTPGNSLPTFDPPWGRTALAICYDLRFPEMWRRYADDGAQLVIIPAEWPVHRVEHWRLLLRARAVENQFFVVGCNRVGVGDDGEFGGHSAAADPWARVLVEAGTKPGLILATLDLDEVAHSRSLLDFLGDRRPEIYG